LILNSAAFGQHYFNKTVDVTGLGYNEVYRGLIHNAYTNTFYLIGTSSSFGLNNPILVEFDQLGNLIAPSFIPNSSTGESFIPGFNNFIFATTSGNQVFCGAMRFEDGASAIVFKINELNDTIWTREFYEPDEYILFSGALEDQNGDYLFTGYTSKYDAVRQAWLVKMDPSGN
ncbi:hypothetical protein, partial [Crocinitomix algicola]|uniref:hypothetical protein n=1 Tax=Crocinitomix algicola TaxID=1740263 RepID=UPI001586128F